MSSTATFSLPYPNASIEDAAQEHDLFENSVAAMDFYYPGWAEKIDLGRFNIHHPDHCVLGQVTGDYWTVVSQFRPDGAPKFNSDVFVFWAAHDLWAEEIKKRQSEPTFTLSELKTAMRDGLADFERIANAHTLILERDPEKQKVTLEFERSELPGDPECSSR